MKQPVIDLHRLTRVHGTENVALVLEIAPKTLEHKRAGHRAFRIYELYRLKLAYPELDIEATVMRCGAATLARMKPELFE
jgi:hypothetical protein